MKTTQSILHTVNQSPFEKPCLKQCLDQFREGDAIVFIENGVMATMTSQPFTDTLVNKTCYALDADIEARGLLELNRNDTIELINYDRFVELCTQYNMIQSWY